MVPPLSKDLRDSVVRWRIEDGKTYCKLADLAYCSFGTISNILCFHHLFRQFTNPFSYQPGQFPRAGSMMVVTNRCRWPHFAVASTNSTSAENTLQNRLQNGMSIYVQFGRERWHNMMTPICLFSQRKFC